MWRFLFISLILLILEVIAVAALISPNTINTAIQKEITYLNTWFGKNKTTDMLTSAQDSFDSMFVHSGVQDEFNSWFEHDNSKVKNKGMRELGESGFITGFMARLDQFWLVLKFSFLRVQMISISLLLAMTFIIPSIVDGLMIRQVNRYGDDNASVNLYNAAEYTFYGCLIFPLYLTFAPFAISPIVMVFYTLTLSASIFILAQNLQHRV